MSTAFGCPKPFLNAADFPSTDGYILGRLCSTVPRAGGNVTCCLPCPKTDWIYPDHFKDLQLIGNYINLAGMTFCLFILLSFAILPVEKTHRHYLSVSLTVGIMIMEVAFIIPLVTKPAQCINAITPNDMRSSLSCAFSGAFLLGGGWCAVIWVFLRALSLHLQICWQIVAGRKFFIGAQLFGWSFPAVFLALVLNTTGVSFRFGDTCQINHPNGLAVFWGPMLGFAAAGIIIQFATFIYCIKVYINSLFYDGATSGSSALPSYSASAQTVSARQAFRRINRVFALQWRGILIVVLIITDVVFFAIVFLKFDQLTGANHKNMRRAQSWLACIILNNGDKNKCLQLAKKLTVNEATVIAVLILLSMNGVWCLLFFGRWGMVIGWIDLFRNKFGRGPKEFVSVDAGRFSQEPRTYEMFSSGIKSPEPAITPSSEESITGRFSPSTGSPTSYYFGGEAKYVSPPLSFSLPRSAVYQAREWDPVAAETRMTMFPGMKDVKQGVSHTTESGLN